MEWWRNEKVVYGRRESGTSVVPVIKDIIRIPKEPARSLTTKTVVKKGRARSKTIENDENLDVTVFNPEEGWDDNTDPHGVVLDFVSHEEVRRSEST